MPIPSQDTLREHPGNGSITTPYPIPFRYDDPAWVRVEVITSSGAVSVLAPGSYTLADGSASAGSLVTHSVAIPTSSTVRITRTTPLTQSNSLVPNGQIPTNTIVASFDKLTMALQDLRGQLQQLEARCYRVPDGKIVAAGALSFQIGSVSHLATGAAPTATLSSSGAAFTLHLGLPTGATGGFDIGDDASFGTTPNNEGGPALTLWDQGTNEYRAIGLEHGTFVVLSYD